MALTETDVLQIAHLARLAIDDADIPAYTRDMSNILSLVADMEQLDTRNVEPMAHPLAVYQRLRTDDVTEVNQREHFQKDVAVATEAGLYLVPKVIDNESKES